jgi:diguanylate cyclase (GGDEF)-like protein
MRPGAPRISTRFFLALIVLLGSLAAVGVLGLRGQYEIQRANDQVFSDNFLTAEATSQLALELGSAERVGLEITAIRGAAELDELRAQLDQTVIPRVNADLATFLRFHAHDPRSERSLLQSIAPAWRVAAIGKRGALTSIGRLSNARERADAADAVADVMNPLILSVSGRLPIEREAASDAHAGAQATYRRDQWWLILAAVIATAAAAVMVRVGIALKRIVDQRASDARFEESASEYIDTLQVTESEEEVQELLRRQIERTVEDVRAVVLVRNNSADRLEAKTSLTEFEALHEPMMGATPRSCLAVRRGREHTEQAGVDALVNCQICGQLPGASTCEPLLVGGEVIGVVLISHDATLQESARVRIRETVARAAPVLANLRNLAIAKLQASTDALTGLPNQRAVQDTLKLMVAQASRTVSPLAALLVDLDHFKKINDVYGHDRGDEVLAAAGVALRTVARESDFVGRYGGEEFLLLLPSTDKQGATQVAEAVRRAIGAVHTPNTDQITASVGVAVLPDDGGDGVTLFRSADRALYSAKRNGRNRVETIAADADGRALLGADQGEHAHAE